MRSKLTLNQGGMGVGNSGSRTENDTLEEVQATEKGKK